MSRPSKPMAKNANSKFTPRNNKQDIFSKMSKATKSKSDTGKQPDINDRQPDTNDK